MMKFNASTAALALTVLATGVSAPSVASAMTSAKKADGSFQVAMLTKEERRARRNANGRTGKKNNRARTAKKPAAPAVQPRRRTATPRVERRGGRTFIVKPNVRVTIGKPRPRAGIRRGRPVFVPRHRGRIHLPARPYAYRPAPRFYPIARCTPGRALDKAYDIGIRRPRVVRNRRNVVVVRGRRRGQPVKVRFGKGPRCPVLNIRHVGRFY